MLARQGDPDLCQVVLQDRQVQDPLTKLPPSSLQAAADQIVESAARALQMCKNLLLLRFRMLPTLMLVAQANNAVKQDKQDKQHPHKADMMGKREEEQQQQTRQVVVEEKNQEGVVADSDDDTPLEKKFRTKQSKEGDGDRDLYILPLSLLPRPTASMFLRTSPPITEHMTTIVPDNNTDHFCGIMNTSHINKTMTTETNLEGSTAVTATSFSASASPTRSYNIQRQDDANDNSNNNNQKNDVLDQENDASTFQAADL
ncbi:hypothetical protein BDB00DRAFT_878777 [Zychaea mexicana]|uniref:uncharacterized protein n=1 Tax=Zychaea mexicana TaxID=64656 RepID=UPI0022FE9C5F|nr:uncharacterized protein BDB00DRAFT_878777 [Zychaea mexicana]KAI9484524.1 hypothetical protein BDB00DRAFT_878777 [Zychaea mexicana]